MVIYDFDFVRVSALPDEADTILVVNSNTVLALAEGRGRMIDSVDCIYFSSLIVGHRDFLTASQSQYPR